MNNKKFYVYVHIKESDNTVFYVGKGSGVRAWDFYGRNVYWKNIKNKHGVRVEILFSDLEEKDAFDLERETILAFETSGTKLANLTKGGEGPEGVSFTDQQRLNIAQGLIQKRYANKERKVVTIKRPKAYGNNNHFADSSLHTFIRLSDGLEVICTRHDLCEKYALDKSLLKKLFYKKSPRKSACGWRLKHKEEDEQTKKKTEEY